MCVGVLGMMTTFLFLKHEKLLEQSTRHDLTNIKTIRNIITDEEDLLMKEVKSLQDIIVKEAEQEAEMITSVVFHLPEREVVDAGAEGQERGSGVQQPGTISLPTDTVSSSSSNSISGTSSSGSGSGSSNTPPVKPATDAPEKRGLLKCGGKYVDSEVIYWKIVPGDNTYESPITPHHDLHHDRYLTYEYDEGGWNNIRMG